MITRRSFLKRLGLAASAVALSPMLDLAPIEPVVEAMVDPGRYEFTIYWMVNLEVHNPRRLGVITGIE